MPSITVQTEHRLYRVSPDAPTPLIRRQQVVAKGRLVDEITTRPPTGKVELGVEQAGYTGRVGRDGIVGLLAVPAEVFPDLDTQAYGVDMTIQVEGYLERRLTVPVPQDANYPAAFTLVDLGDIELHREPTLVVGRTVASNATGTTPVANAVVRVTDIWRTMPPPEVDPPTVAEPPLLVSLSPGLYFDRHSPAGLVRVRDMTPVVGQDKEILEQMPAGSQRLRLSDRVNLSPGNVILIDVLDPELAEYLTVDTIAVTSPAEQPAEISFTYPCVSWHRAGATVRKVAPQAPGPTNLLDTDALAGDVCVFLQSLAGLAAAQTVEVVAGGPTLPEHQHGSRFVVSSDADGNYRLPPLSRIAQIELEADDGSKQTTRTFSPDYSQKVNRCDLVFS